MSGGASIATLARALTDRLLVPLKNRELWQFSLTCRRPERCFVVAVFASFCELVVERDRRIGLLGSVDVSKNDRYHLHLLAWLPPDRDPRDLIRWWCRNSGAARIAHLPGRGFRRVKDRADLEHHVLKHNLDAAGRLADTVSLAERVALVGALVDRVRAVGPLGLVWRSVAGALSVPGVEPLAVEADDHRERASLPRPRRGPGGVCAWCLEAIGPKASASAVWCQRGSCRQMASNALAREAKNVSFDLKKYVDRKEEMGWARPEALRAARCELLGLDGATDAWASKRDRFARCRAPGCSRRLGVRVTDRTCGAPACRQRVHRHAQAAARLGVDDPMIQVLDAAGYRGVALRLAHMKANDGPSYSSRLVERSMPLAAHLSFEPRSFADLYRRAKVRPMTRVDETETTAAWIGLGLGIEVAIIKSELRFSLPFPWGEPFDISLAEHYAHREVLAKIGRLARLGRLARPLP